MSLFFEQRTGAHVVLGVTAAVAVGAESWATYATGAGADASRLRRLLRSVYATVFAKNRGRGATSDRGTEHIVVGGSIIGLLAMVWIAERFPGARAGANDWFGVGLGATLALAGIGLRVWAVHTLGRFFEREVVIDPEQTLVHAGPYRWLRHPAYAGNLVMWFGIGLAIGSWVGALVGTAIILLAHLPRIRVEERVLLQAFGPDYERQSSKWRLIPGVW